MAQWHPKKVYRQPQVPTGLWAMMEKTNGKLTWEMKWQMKKGVEREYVTQIPTSGGVKISRNMAGSCGRHVGFGAQGLGFRDRTWVLPLTPVKL